MKDKSATFRPSPLLFIILFVLAAAALGYVTLRHQQDYVTLNINHEWRVYLTGEDRLSAVAYRRMRVMEHDSHELSLQGLGEIHWGHNTIRVYKAGIAFNNKLFSKSQSEPAVDIVFSRDGTAHRGKPGKNPD